MFVYLRQDKVSFRTFGTWSTDGPKEHKDGRDGVEGPGGCRGSIRSGRDLPGSFRVNGWVLQPVQTLLRFTGKASGEGTAEGRGRGTNGSTTDTETERPRDRPKYTNNESSPFPHISVLPSLPPPRGSFRRVPVTLSAGCGRAGHLRSTPPRGVPGSRCCPFRSISDRFPVPCVITK